MLPLEHAECSLWNILQYFWPALSNNWSWNPNIGLFFEWPLKTGFTLIFGRKMQLILFICVFRTYFTFWNVQSDLSIRLTHSLYWFCHAMAQGSLEILIYELLDFFIFISRSIYLLGNWRSWCSIFLIGTFKYEWNKFSKITKIFV